MLDHMRRVDGFNRRIPKRQPLSDIKPEIEFVKRIRVNIYEAWKKFWPATKVQVSRVAISGTD
jgi:hypothetical protein